ncbi:MAG TPA: hypothetical protein VI894_03230 [Candidatus Nanoarchaeia archaeon]|nr:hypothetical protein [Candidatus Nanoarchaeia archaeon]
MAGEKTTKIALYVFLIFFVILAGAIAVYIVNIYRGVASFTNETTPKLVQCVGYAAEIREISYENSVLKFVLRNPSYSDFDLSEIIIESKFQQKKIGIIAMKGDEKQVVVENFDVQDEFLVYPPECRREAKKCSVLKKEC